MINNLFLSVGAMKAGTTWLYQQIKDHPSVYFTPEKEIHYFANKVGIENQLNHRSRILKLKSVMESHVNGNAKYLSNNLEEIHWYSKFALNKQIDNLWYKSLFSEASDSVYCADFSNLYCQMDSAGWDNVHKISKNTKVIYTLRDPLSRVWSHYKFHMKWIGKEDEALEAGFDHFKALLNNHWFWVNSLYATNYLKVIDNVPKENVMLLYFEDFRKDPQKEMDRITDFLDISNVTLESDKTNKKVNQTKDYKMPDSWRDYVLEKLEEEYTNMKQLDIIHPDWRSIK